MAGGGQQEEARPRTRGPSREKTARTRAAIIAAAMAEFLERGFAAATMASIARRAGVAKGTSYLYFETKEALFAGIVSDVITNPLGEAEQQEIGPGESVAAYIRRTLLPVMETIEQGGRAAVARLVIAEGAKFPFLIETYRREVYDPFLAHLGALARRAHARGEVKDDTLARHPHLLAAPLWIGMIHNGVIDPLHRVDIAALFAAQITLCFGPPEGDG
ncbi:TetR/AcrR family transcriptional regulator [Xanthobacter sp. V2C-8]|uniref:TetR/AcrR family transcriptional regulator n=1 Tax=Xanthobacter albus TaxID=3119929 RepID=UPI00372A3449